VTGLLSASLPANFESGSRLRIDAAPQAAIEFFDANTGELQLSVNGSRLPQSVTYSLLDDDQNVIETRRHTMVVSDIRIMPLGDSITQGVEFYDGTSDLPIKSERVGYRLSLYDSLLVDGISFDFVGQSGQRAGENAGLPDPDNNGYPGVGVDFIHNVLDAVLEESKPDVILLHIGTNFTPDTAEGIDAIILKVNQWSQANTPVSLFIATLVPKRRSDLQPIVDDFNADLRERMQQVTGENVILVEQALALDVSDISTEEVGVHPNAGGYIKMAETWLNALQDAKVVASCS